jgi:hypothetical protein
LYAFLIASIHATCLAHLSHWFDHPNNVWWRAQTANIIVTSFLLLLDPNILPKEPQDSALAPLNLLCEGTGSKAAGAWGWPLMSI